MTGRRRRPLSGGLGHHQPEHPHHGRESRHPQVIGCSVDLDQHVDCSAARANPAEQRGFREATPGSEPRSLQRETSWRKESDSNPRYLLRHPHAPMSKRRPGSAIRMFGRLREAPRGCRRRCRCRPVPVPAKRRDVTPRHCLRRLLASNPRVGDSSSSRRDMTYRVSFEEPQARSLRLPGSRAIGRSSERSNGLPRGITID